MRKIGIITLNGYYNYGNRLQNYALQEVLKTYNYHVETLWIDNIRLISQNPSRVTKIKKALLNPKAIAKKINNKLFYEKVDTNRTSRFKKFSNDYIHETSFRISENHLPKDILDEYDYFVTGSDQVWNPYFTKGSPLYHLTFAPKEKRIAYAPSFGISEIPDKYVGDFKNWLAEMEALSVREEAGAKIIKELTGREAHVIADPTILLTKDQWLTIAKAADNKPKEDFLLTYYLGKIPKTTEEFIKKHAKKHKLKIVNLAKVKEEKYYLTDPSEFIDYINSAKLFITDSFHGAVFSILFETPFVITDRQGSIPSMNSRINTLLSTFALQSRHITNIKKDVFDIDFSHVEAILARERTRAYDYLKLALKSG